MADPIQSNSSSPERSYGQLPQGPQHPVPCEEYRILWCLFLGNKEPFKVALPHVDIDVDDLKELIHTKGIDTTKSTVLANDLILWRVRVLLNNSDHPSLFRDSQGSRYHWNQTIRFPTVLA
jgi:hypothetical protein